MIDDVVMLISAYTGYEVPKDDMALISYFWKASEKGILADINQEALPDALDPLHTRMTAGQYINARLGEMVGDDGLQTIGSITEGKVSVDITGDSPADRLKSLAMALCQDGGNECACFRKIHW